MTSPWLEAGLSGRTAGIKIADHYAPDVCWQAQLIADVGCEVLHRDSAQRSFRGSFADTGGDAQIGWPLTQREVNGHRFAVSE